MVIEFLLLLRREWWGLINWSSIVHQKKKEKKKQNKNMFLRQTLLHVEGFQQIDVWSPGTPPSPGNLIIKVVMERGGICQDSETWPPAKMKCDCHVLGNILMIYCLSITISSWWAIKKEKIGRITSSLSHLP